MNTIDRVNFKETLIKKQRFITTTCVINNDLIVIIDTNSKGYYNLTDALAKCEILYDNKPTKTFEDWLQINSHIEIMKDIATLEHKHIKDMFYTLKNQKEEIYNGTYIHPELIHNILTWINPKFAEHYSQKIGHNFIN